MKTVSQFAKWLDAQTKRLDAMLEPVQEIELDIDGDIREIIMEAHRFAINLGCDKVQGVTAREILGKYRAWVTPQLPKEDLTVDEAAEKLGVSTQTVRAMVKDGRIAHHRVGRQIRIRPEDCAMQEKPRKYDLLDRHVKRRQSRGSKPSQAS